MTDVPELKTLGSLVPGNSGTLAEFEINGHHNGYETIERLREMGFDEGLKVELLHQSPIGKDPIAVRVGTMTVALRRKDADLIKVALA